MAGAAELPPVLLGDDGSVLPADLAMLREHEAAAAAARDYRRAGFLADTVEALRPKPRLTLEECSAAGVEEQHAF
eukprot:SAG22_NODE_16603_length_322_cov_0.421525_1_plen_74_part_01